MVTTSIAWVAGILLIAVAISPAGFERLLRAVARPPAPSGRHATATWTSEHPLVRICRLLALTVGVVCLVLGALGSAPLLS